MPAMTTEVAKAQPWKTHWSPNSKSTSSTAGQEYLASSIGNLIVDGIVQGGSPKRFSELACSEKEDSSTATEAPKAQPWKAHWSPNDNKNASDTTGQQYLAGSNGKVIVDGIVQGGSPDRFSELASSSKKEEKK
ncbi:hypothetical protein G7Y79_00057g090870 [Physcia stellaris]|nr:hypothetical protein G7Y79_00057g090870 [Physcia stellaris]